MDSQKDIQKTDGLTKFIDNQALKTNPFGENRVGERAYRRAERLAAAIVLLTNHISESDPLKRSARIAAIDLLAHVMAVKDEMRASNSEHGRELKSSVRTLISLVRLLAVSGSVSFQNADAVTEALDELTSFLNASRRSTLSETVSISREELIDIRDTHSFADSRASDKSKNSKEDTVESTGTAGVSIGGNGPTAQASSRALAIIEVLRVHGELGIRDVAANLPEYSEKMIQRELVDLVTAGRVKKSGLKRWSRYSVLS